MSQNTTASSSSFSSQHRSGSNFYANPATNYPNLAILATYSKDMNAAGGGNGIMQHLTWSEITDEELVENLGGRERTRQEVLFEMVCSEERYVQELLVS
jgi:secreted trypsin-like serine protease